MMAAAFLLAQVTSAVPVPAVPPAAAPKPVVPAALAIPTDVTALPPLPLLRPWRNDPALGRFVRDEVRARRCTAGTPTRVGYTLDMSIAVLVTSDGQVRRLVPQAIGCPSVEQYAAGLASRMVRGNVAAPGADVWYRLPVAFRWQR